MILCAQGCIQGGGGGGGGALFNKNNRTKHACNLPAKPQQHQYVGVAMGVACSTHSI